MYQQSYTGTVRNVICVPRTPHCGVNDGPTDFVVTVTIDYLSPEPLDHQGFLVDSTYFAAYFAGWDGRMLDSSCEKFADTVAREFCAHANRYHGPCQARVTIGNPQLGTSVSRLRKSPAADLMAQESLPEVLAA